VLAPPLLDDEPLSCEPALALPPPPDDPLSCELEPPPPLDDDDALSCELELLLLLVVLLLEVALSCELVLPPLLLPEDALSCELALLLPLLLPPPDEPLSCELEMALLSEPPCGPATAGTATARSSARSAAGIKTAAVPPTATSVCLRSRSSSSRCDCDRAFIVDLPFIRSLRRPAAAEP